MKAKLDENYYVAILDVKTHKIIGEEHKFRTLEEVLGFLHNFEEEKNRERILTCLMGLRDGQSEVTFGRKQFRVGKQILRIRPAKGFHDACMHSNKDF